MFGALINNFRPRDIEQYLTIGLDAESNIGFQHCMEFLDEFIHDDNADIHTLSDYLSYGENGDGTVNARLIGKIAILCDSYRAQYAQAM